MQEAVITAYDRALLCHLMSAQVFKRVDLAKREEEFQQIGSFSKEPGPADITPLFKPVPKAPTWKQYWKP